MSRSRGDTIVDLLTADALNDDIVQSLFIQAADAETLDRLLFQQQLAFAKINAESSADWELSHFDLAGSGDGHTFALNTTWVDRTKVAEVSADNLVSPARMRLFFFLASQAAALGAARQRVQQKLAELFDPPVNATQVAEIQTVLSGAEQGTRVMGGVLVETIFIT
jgi:hypothetical protein